MTISVAKRKVSGALVLAALLVAQAGPASGDARSDEEARISAIYRTAMSQGSGGTYGFYVKPVGGAPELSHEEGHVYDPASAIKALHHLYGVRSVRQSSDSLTNSVTVYRYPSAGSDPSSPRVCPRPADETPANAEFIPLREALMRTMVFSDNRTTRALELRYGRTQLNGLAASIGMSATRLDQIIGCGYADGRRNATSLVDLGTLYESVADLRSVDEDGRSLFYAEMSFVRYPPGHSFVENVVRDEAQKLGIESKVTNFAGYLFNHLKGGSYDICIGTCANREIVRDVAGVLTVPFRDKRRKSVQLRDYVWGSFIEGSRIVCNSSGCPGGDAAGQAAYTDGVHEMFRTVIRNALETWKRSKK